MDTETDASFSHDDKPDSKDVVASVDKKSFGLDVGKLVSGTVIAQIIGFCAYPIITRLFEPEIYGVYTLVLSIVSILTIIGCFRYEVAIVLPKENKDASSLVFASFFILIGVCLVSSIIIFLFGKEIGILLNSPNIVNYLWIVPILLFVICFYTILRFWNTRQKRFGVQATTQIAQTLSLSGMQLGFGFSGFITPGALLIGHLLGNLTGTIILFWQNIKRDARILISGLSFENIKKQVIIYKKFPLVDTWGNLINTLSWQVPPLLLAAFFSPAVTGAYALGLLLIQTPMSLIGGSLGQVYLQRGANAHRAGSLPILLQEITVLLLVLSIVPISLLFTMGGTLFGTVFGENWVEAGIYCQILAAWAFIWFLSSTTGASSFSIIGRQELMLRCAIINMITRLFALIIGGITNNIYITLWLFSLMGILSYGYGFFLLFKTTKSSFKYILTKSWKSILIAIFVIVLSWCLNYVLNLNGILLLIIATLICVLYYLYLYKSNEIVSSYFPIKLISKLEKKIRL